MLDILKELSILKDTVSVLTARVGQLELENASLKLENAHLISENTTLRDRLSKNSGNSNKPPSSDGLTKKPALPKASGKKRGGQFGHKGTTLKKIDSPDHTILHIAESCSCCAKKFSAADVVQIGQTRQVFDIPTPRIEVTEHRIGHINCCGQVHRGTFPPMVTNITQYGSQIKALSVLLNTDYKMPLDKIEQLLSDIYACSFNASTAISANISCFESLTPIERIIKEKVRQSQVVNFDETGMRVAGKLHWFHTASTDAHTYLFVHPKRGKIALQSDESLIKDFQNWAVHDCWASYFDFKQCNHALCNAHILRELQNLKEKDCRWAINMHDLLMDLYRLSEKATVIVQSKAIWVKKYQAICIMADQEEPPPTKKPRGKPKNSKGRNLMLRLTKHQDEVLAFAFTEHVPFTNNQAERDIRCLKTKQKVSNSFRTFDGAKHFARIQSFISSVRKHTTNVFQQLIRIFNQQVTIFQVG